MPEGVARWCFGLRFAQMRSYTGPSRVFVVKASSAFVKPDLNIKALASYGRLDVVARAAIAALSTRRGPRPDTVFYAVLEGSTKPVTVEFRGWEVPGRALASEAQVGEVLRALARGMSVPGASIVECDFKRLVLRLLSSLGPTRIFYMHEHGVDISQVELGEPAAFILGDHKGVERSVEQWLKDLGVRWLSLGPTPYFTEHCITYVHAVLDRAPVV